MEIDDVIEDGVICVRHDLFNRSNSSDSSTSEVSDAEAEVDYLSQKLCLWNVQYNITRDACGSLLHILKPLHPELPLDPRTLNQTPRKAAIQNLRNGSYAHVGLISGLQKRVESGLNIDGNMRIGIDVNIDGINMTKSTITDVWPILRPFVVGFFVGTGKPDPLEDYLHSFIEETLQLFNDTLTVGESKYEVYIRCFICDAPARQYIKRIVGHASYNACERYEDVIHQSDPEHHVGVSPLLRLNLKMVSQFALDPFHLVLEGVVKRYLMFVLRGTKSGMRLRGESILEISRRLVELRKYIPMEFARKPVGLEQLGKWKGTQLRFFLLYGGCVVLKDVVAEILYKLFIMLQIAIIIFSVQKLIDDENYFSFAKDLIAQFVILSSNKDVFGEKFCVYNIHGLLHLYEDVRKYGEISSISAFPFESFLGIFKQMLRSPTKPIQQLFRRLAERNFLDDFCERIINFQSHLTPKNPIHGTNNYKILTSSLFTLSSVHRRDSYFQYKGSVASVRSIQKLENGDVVIIANICDTKTNFFDYPCKSSYFGIYNLGCMKWTQTNVIIPINAVTTKYVVLPYENDNIAIPLLHSF
ncbi:hypothetical protein ALC57_12189 [Trachymyrmex cornetzi]|uniref:Transposase domain-containing protein n=1 Tax=Trachymyrmex cornetzi TaxID=471704 RepID=A0A151J193_9HYME|nr:hypothetical protein ALC57_12189 [Trachymyrmex cornetzi]